MNESIHSDSPSDQPKSNRDPRVPVADTSMMPGAEKDRPAAVGLLKRAGEGAHHTIDRLADGAEPAVRQLGEGVSAAEESLRAKTDPLRETRDEWAVRARATVRENPLTSVVAALALGAVIGRIARIAHGTR